MANTDEKKLNKGQNWCLWVRIDASKPTAHDNGKFYLGPKGIVLI